MDLQDITPDTFTVSDTYLDDVVEGWLDCVEWTSVHFCHPGEPHNLCDVTDAGDNSSCCGHELDSLERGTGPPVHSRPRARSAAHSLRPRLPAVPASPLQMSWKRSTYTRIRSATISHCRQVDTAPASGTVATVRPGMRWTPSPRPWASTARSCFRTCLWAFRVTEVARLDTRGTSS